MKKEEVVDYNGLVKLDGELEKLSKDLQSKYSKYHNAIPAPNTRAKAAEFAIALTALIRDTRASIEKTQGSM